MVCDTDRRQRTAVPSRRQAMAALVAVGAAAAAAPATLGLGAGNAAALVPMPKVRLPAAVEGFSPYLPQVVCDPVEKPGVRAFRSLILSTYRQGSDAGIVRSCRTGGRSEHKEGRAWDWFIDYNDTGERVAAIRTLNWLLMYDAENARRVGLMYVIWMRHIWASYRPEDGWRRYTGPNPHTDHVHFSFSWAGARKQTSWWTGRVAPIDRGPASAAVALSEGLTDPRPDDGALGSEPPP